MDVNKTLAELRMRAFVVMEQADSPHGVIEADDAERLADLITAMDLWLSNGGFLPDAWQR